MKHQRGFTLVELIVVIVILGVLAAMATPKYVEMRQEARVASLGALAAALQVTTNEVHALCATIPACDYTQASQQFMLKGKAAGLNYGWLDAGDSIGGNEIDAWVNYSGFTPVLPNTGMTVFTLDGSPNPSTCAVAYYDAYFRGPNGPLVAITSTGC